MNPYLLINLNQKYRPAPPINLSSIELLMKKLSFKSQVICVLEAVNMVSYIWEEYVLIDKVLTKEQKEVAKKAIEIIQRLLNGLLNREESLESVVEELNETCHKIKATYHTIVTNTLELNSYAAVHVTLSIISVIAIFSDRPLHDIYNTSNAILSAGKAYAYKSYEKYNKLIWFEDCRPAFLLFFNQWWNKCFDLILDRDRFSFQDEYNIFCENI